MRTLDSIAIIIPIALVAIVALVFIQTSPKHLQTPSAPITSQVSQIPKQKIEEVKSSDGTKSLKIVSIEKQAGVTEFQLIVINNQDSTQKIIYTDTFLDNSFLKYSLNSWSNDNQKFFIEKVSPTGTSYLVFKADGSNFPDDQPYLNVNDYWSKAHPDLKIATLTGWADKDLIIVYSTKADDSEGPSFWFVVSSKKFLQLATRPID